MWGICRCGKWGIAPKEFKENKHFLKCICGNKMYLDRHDPKEAAYPDKDKIEITELINQ